MWKLAQAPHRQAPSFMPRLSAASAGVGPVAGKPGPGTWTLPAPTLKPDQFSGAGRGGPASSCPFGQLVCVCSYRQLPRRIDAMNPSQDVPNGAPRRAHKEPPSPAGISRFDDRN